jgi:hypothetical protein
MKTSRLLILGAGFSAPAGIPLSADLFKIVRRRIKIDYGLDNSFEEDLHYYKNYLQNTQHIDCTDSEIDLETFLSFLDIEHYLKLKGSDTLSSEGNLTQLRVKQAISYIILDRIPKKIPDIYRIFVDKCEPSDCILTFNYDTLLERAFESIGKPYRLFPDRYTRVDPFYGLVDMSKEEVILLKLHGSVDWFDKSSYIEMDELIGDSQPHNVHHPIFGKDPIVVPEPIVDGPRSVDDPLVNIYRVRDPIPLYRNKYYNCVPYLLYPSSTKLLYVKPIVDFWNGLGKSGGLNLGFGIIGYSLPRYDDYACQAIYKMARNYQYYEPNHKIEGRQKRPIRILDLRTTNKSRQSLRNRYCFMKRNRTDYRYDGLSIDSINWIMD